MVDAETKEFFRTIEDHFVRLRRSPITLSSNDFHRICRWKEQGIPLNIVLRGINKKWIKANISITISASIWIAITILIYIGKSNNGI